MIYIFGGLAVLQTVLILLFFSLWKKSHNEILGIRKQNINIADQTLSDMQIEQEQPLRIKVGQKQLFVEMFTYAEYTYFLNDFYKFLLLLKSQHLQLDFVVLNDKTNNKYTEQMIAILANKRATKEMLKIIKKYLLKNKKTNPDKIRIKYLMKYMKPDSFLQIFWSLKKYNIGDLKKNCQFLLAAMGDKSQANTTISPSSSWNPLVGKVKNSMKPNYPEYARWCAEEGKQVIITDPKKVIQKAG